MPSHHIELICFDIGNVLIELSSGWHQACAEADVLFPDTADDIAIIDHLDALNREHECGRIDADSFDAQAAQITGLAPHQVRISSATLGSAATSTTAACASPAAQTRTAAAAFAATRKRTASGPSRSRASANRRSGVRNRQRTSDLRCADSSPPAGG